MCRALLFSDKSFIILRQKFHFGQTIITFEPVIGKIFQKCMLKFKLCLKFRSNRSTNNWDPRSKFDHFVWKIEKVANVRQAVVIRNRYKVPLRKWSKKTARGSRNTRRYLSKENQLGWKGKVQHSNSFFYSVYNNCMPIYLYRSDFS